MRRIWFAVIPFVLLYPLGAIAGEKKPSFESFESFAYSGFKTIEKIVWVTVTVKGSAEKLGLREDELTDLLKLRFKNTFTGMKVEKKPRWSELRDKKTRAKFGVIHLIVWTVGDDYPVAYHITIRAGNFSDPGVYENAVLGHGSKSNVPRTVRETISELMDDLAIAFFKARGSM